MNTPLASLSYEDFMGIYKECGYSKSVVAEKLGVTTTAVCAHMTKRGIETIPKRPKIERDDLEEMYSVQGMSMKEIAKKTGFSRSVVFRLIKKYNIPTRSFQDGFDLYYQKNPNARSQIKHHLSPEQKAKLLEGARRYKETRPKKRVRINEKGYLVYTCGSKKGRPVHRVIMEEHLGRKLSKEECVHHINEDKLDNRIENLQVLSRGEHTTIHNPHNRGSRKVVAPADKSPHAILSWENVHFIRTHPELSCTELAKKYGVSYTCIRMIRRNESWKEN